MKRLFALILCTALLTAGLWPCSVQALGEEEGPNRYSASFIGLFDTVTAMVGISESKESFTAEAQRIHDQLAEYHRLFDVYHDYEGLNNLKTINDHAGIAPVKVDPAIIDLLLFCREMAQKTGGLVDVTQGSVLRLWHQARTDRINFPVDAYLPASSRDTSLSTSVSPLIFSLTKVSYSSRTSSRLILPEFMPSISVSG